ncbi:MAG: hypothetical protein JXB10_18920 [Pirellulales bacterium]|nr:hypothetical protein [Pirellulales bacterium]
MPRLLLTLTVFVCLGGAVWAQNAPAQPDQPVYAAGPTLQRRPAPPNAARQVLPPQPTFRLTPEEEARLDQVLTAWEKEGQKISTFDCKFKRWEYYPDLARTREEAEKPAHVDYGVINYAAPDKGRYQILYTDQKEADGKTEIVSIEENRAELYICDGKAVYKYEPRKPSDSGEKAGIRHDYPLPPELQGKEIVNSPLPFIFGADAKKLRQRYWMRIVTPPPDKKNQIWIEAHPRYQEEAANFTFCLLILETPKLRPLALRMVYPGEKNWASYQFYDVTVNDPLRIIKSNPFQACLPRGWDQVVHPAQSANAPQPPPGLR